MIAELDIETAELAIEAARQDVIQAENTPAAFADVGVLYASAQGRLRHAVAALDRLVAQRDAERAAAEAFTEAEKGAAKRLAAMDKEAAASRENVKAAVAAAQDALVALVDAVDERNGTLSRHAEELAGLGLVMPAGGESEHQNGVTSRCEVQLRGGWWKFLDAAAVVNLVAERVNAARFPDRVGLRLTIRRLAMATRLFERPDLDLEAVPLPAEAAPRLLPRIQSAGPVTGAPVYLSTRGRAEAAASRGVQWTEYHDNPGAYAGGSF